MRWGRGGWSFPASRLGAGYGAVSCMLLGSVLMIGAMNGKSSGDGSYLLVGAVVWMIFGVCMAIRDYFLHSDKKGE